MGRITIFTQPRCKYCDKVKAVLQHSLDVNREALAAVKPQYGIEIVIYDVSKDPARSAQCTRLSKAHTVPQVFFNQEHIGNAGSCTVFSQCGQLKQRLLALAGTPHDGLPTPEASLTKVDSQVAFSSQPTTAQISRLRSYGFATMLNLAHPDEPGSVSTESALATHVGLQYVACPPAVPARVATSHVEVDLIPNITCTPGSSCAPSLCPTLSPSTERVPSALLEEEDGSAQAGAAEAAQEDAVARLAPARSATAQLPRIDTGLLAPASGSGTGSFVSRTSSAPRALDTADSLETPAADSVTPTAARQAIAAGGGDSSSDAGDASVAASPAMKSEVSGLTGFASDFTVWALDGGDLSGPDPTVHAWTEAWLRAALAAVERADKPVLIHDSTGVAACAVALTRAAATLGEGVAKVLAWARALGHDLEQHGDLVAAVQLVLMPQLTAMTGQRQRSVSEALGDGEEPDSPVPDVAGGSGGGGSDGGSDGGAGAGDAELVDAVFGMGFTT